jgi:hypothetical protein
MQIRFLRRASRACARGPAATATSSQSPASSHCTRCGRAPGEEVLRQHVDRDGDSWYPMEHRSEVRRSRTRWEKEKQDEVGKE